MSVSNWAIVAVGVRFSKEEKEKILESFAQVDFIEGCPHFEEKGEFCSKCGAKRQIEHKSYKAYNGRWYDHVHLDEVLPRGVYVQNYSSGYCVIHLDGAAFMVIWEDLVQRIPFCESEEIKDKTKEILEPIGLWKEEKFGMWLFCDAR